MNRYALLTALLTCFALLFVAPAVEATNYAVPDAGVPTFSVVAQPVVQYQRQVVTQPVVQRYVVAQPVVQQQVVLRQKVVAQPVVAHQVVAQPVVLRQRAAVVQPVRATPVRNFLFRGQRAAVVVGH